MRGLRTALIAGIVTTALPARAQSADPAASAGVTPTVIYDGDGFADAVGGLRRGTTYVGNLHLQATLDGEALFHVPGVTVFLNALGVHGGSPGDFSGDAQGVSNMAAPSEMKLYEAWLQWNLFSARLSILAGRYDLNTEFYRLQAGGLFLNGSFGIGPELGQSGVAGPSIFPSTSLGARVAYKPAPNVVLRAAVLDGVPVDRPDGTIGAFEPGDGALVVAEAAFLTRPAPTGMPRSPRFRIGRASGLPPYDDKLAIGGWVYSTALPDLSEVDAAGQPVRRRGTGGAYLIGEHQLLQRAEGAVRRLAVFLQAGYADARVVRFGTYVGAGLVSTGLVPARPSDELGLAVAAARNGSHYLAARAALARPTTSAEVAIELTYLAQVTGWLAVQPDVQYIVHPDTDPTRPDALALQLRFEVAL